MKHIELVKEFGGAATAISGPDKTVTGLYDGPFRKIVEVRLREHAVLAKHKANVPITVFCYSGTGTFLAGPQLEDEQTLIPGTLITLEADVEHEVIADPELHLIVTKFMPR